MTVSEFVLELTHRNNSDRERAGEMSAHKIAEIKKEGAELRAWLAAKKAKEDGATPS
jgi:hypothetical protein